MDSKRLLHGLFMKISVIIPVYNVEKYIATCINSILDQTYNNFEVILVDDGSSDSSGQICDEFAIKDARIKVIHKSNSGVSDSRNKGISQASGQYICFIDGDDFIEKNYFEKVFQLIANYSPKVLINSYKLFYENGKILEPFKKTSEKVLSRSELLKDLLRGKYYGWSPFGKFYHYSIVKDVRFNKDYCYGEDLLFIYDLINKLSDSDSILYAPLCSYMYVQRETSACYAYPVDKKFDCVKIYEHIIKTADQETSEYIYYNLYLRSLIRLKYRMLQCNYDKNKSYYIKCDSVPRKKFIWSFFNPRMKLKPRILLVINFFPNFIFKILMSKLVGKND